MINVEYDDPSHPHRDTVGIERKEEGSNSMGASSEDGSDVLHKSGKSEKADSTMKLYCVTYESEDDADDDAAVVIQSLYRCWKSRKSAAALRRARDRRIREMMKLQNEKHMIGGGTVGLAASFGSPKGRVKMQVTKQDDVDLGGSLRRTDSMSPARRGSPLSRSQSVRSPSRDRPDDSTRISRLQSLRNFGSSLTLGSSPQRKAAAAASAKEAQAAAAADGQPQEKRIRKASSDPAHTLRRGAASARVLTTADRSPKPSPSPDARERPANGGGSVSRKRKEKEAAAAATAAEGSGTPVIRRTEKLSEGSGRASSAAAAEKEGSGGGGGGGADKQALAAATAALQEALAEALAEAEVQRRASAELDGRLQERSVQLEEALRTAEQLSALRGEERAAAERETKSLAADLAYASAERDKASARLRDALHAGGNDGNGRSHEAAALEKQLQRAREAAATMEERLGSRIAELANENRSLEEASAAAASCDARQLQASADARAHELRRVAELQQRLEDAELELEAREGRAAMLAAAQASLDDAARKKEEAAAAELRAQQDEARRTAEEKAAAHAAAAAEAEARAATLEARGSQLAGEKAAADNTVRLLEEGLARERSERGAAGGVASHMQQKLEGVEGELRAAASATAAAEAREGALREEVAALRRQHAEAAEAATRRAAELSAELAAKERAAFGAEAELGSLRAQLSRARGEHAASQREVAALADEAARSQRRVETLDADLRQAAAARAAAEGGEESQREQAATLQRRLAAAEEEAGVRAVAEASAREGEASGFAAEKAALEARAAAAERGRVEDAAAADGARRELQARAAALQGEVREAAAAREAAEAQARALQSQAARARDDAERGVAELARVRQALEKASSASGSKDETEASREVRAAKLEVEAALDQLQHLRRELAEANSNNAAAAAAAAVNGSSNLPVPVPAASAAPAQPRRSPSPASPTVRVVPVVEAPAPPAELWQRPDAPRTVEVSVARESAQEKLGTVWREKNSLLLLKVFPGSPADRAGAGDYLQYTLVRANGELVFRVTDLVGRAAGQHRVTLTFSLLSPLAAAVRLQRQFRRRLSSYLYRYRPVAASSDASADAWASRHQPQSAAGAARVRSVSSPARPGSRGRTSQQGSPASAAAAAAAAAAPPASVQDAEGEVAALRAEERRLLHLAGRVGALQDAGWEGPASVELRAELRAAGVFQCASLSGVMEVLETKATASAELRRLASERLNLAMRQSAAL